jgi:protein-disulfide isomerase
MVPGRPTLLAQGPAPEEMQALRDELTTLRAGQKSMQTDLLEIKKILSVKSGTPPHQAIGAVVDVAGKPFKGDKNARVTLIEFSEYQCPFCARHVQQTQPQIQTNYVDTGKVKLVFQDLPLAMHQLAPKAAEATHCAGDQGKYWVMQNHLFANMKALAPTNLTAHAETLHLDVAKFQQCLDSGKFTAMVQASAEEAKKLGLTGTPSFVLGLTDPASSKVKVVKVIIGAQKYSAFQEAIDELLAQAK